MTKRVPSTVTTASVLSRCGTRWRTSAVNPSGARSSTVAPPDMENGVAPAKLYATANAKYGLTVRVKQEIDLRRFPSLPRATKRFERLYEGRTAVERVNGRLKVFWGIDDGQVFGSRRFHGHVGAVMVVHLAFATLLAQTARYEGTFGKMSLSPIAKALRELVQGTYPETTQTAAGQ